MTVVVEDLRGQIRLLTRLDDPLAHLQRDECREPVAVLGQQFPRTMDGRGSLLDRPVTPGAEGLVRGLDGAVDGSRVEAVELPQHLLGVGIRCRVVMGRRCRHGRVSSPARASSKLGRARTAAIRRTASVEWIAPPSRSRQRSLPVGSRRRHWLGPYVAWRTLSMFSSLEPSAPATVPIAAPSQASAA